MSDRPLLLMLMAATGIYVAKLWSNDCRAALAGKPNPGALPGAASAPLKIVVVAIA